MNTHIRFPAALGLAVLAFCGGAAGQTETRASTDRMDAIVRAEMERQKIPGVSVAVVKGGEVVVAKGYGIANVEHRVPVTAETIFQSGSCGKQFTAAAVMLQVEDEKLGLDDPVTKYFTDAPETWKAITVRHLLTHTSGIPDYTVSDFDYRKDYTEDELARMAYRLKLEFAPGSRWNYSNTGYALLGILVGKVSGHFYGDVLKERVFVPLGMKTARILSEEDIVANRAGGYRLERGELKNQEWVAPKLNTTGDGSMYLSILDFVAWDQGVRSGAVLEPASWKAVFTPVTLNSGRTFPYGFGWSLDTALGQPKIHHGGAWQGFKAYICRWVGPDLTVIALANLAQANPARIVDRVAAVFEPSLGGTASAPATKLSADPAIEARLRVLLDAASQGKLSPDEFAYVRAGFFPGMAKRYAELLGPLGKPKTIDLLERRESGDDQLYRFVAVYESGSFLVSLALAPDGKVAQFGLGRP